MTEYQLCLSDEIEGRLKVKCDMLADAFIMDDIGLSLSLNCHLGEKPRFLAKFSFMNFSSCRGPWGDQVF